MRLILLLFLFVPLFAMESDYASIIKMARQGAYQQALQQLQALRLQNPDNKRMLYDYIVIAGWANKNDEVIATAKSQPLATYPSYVLEIVAKAYRNEKLYDKAIETYKACLAKEPGRSACREGLVLSLVDAKRFDEAKRTLRSLHSRDAVYYYLLGYLYENEKEWYDAFAAYQKALQSDPSNNEAYRAFVRTLHRIGLPSLAYRYYSKRPQLFSPAFAELLRKDQAAFRIRWGETLPAPPQKRFEETDQALHDIEQLLATPNLSPTIALQLQYDRIVALRDRFYMRKAIELYEKLRKKGVSFPYYTLNAVADAYLYLQKPRKAYVLYRQALEKNPDHFESKIGIFYCYIEMFEPDRAIAWIDALDAKEKAWIGKHPNEHKIVTTTDAALARYYADYLGEAQRRLERLVSLAPMNMSLQGDLANLYKDRGWPRKALQKTTLVLTYEPQNSEARVTRALALMDLYRFEEAQDLIQALRRG